jgi:hypothetical protein
MASPHRDEFKIMLDELDWMDHKVYLDDKIISVLLLDIWFLLQQVHNLFYLLEE